MCAGCVGDQASAREGGRYRALHAGAWPGVLETLRTANITNYSIFLRDGLLFSYLDTSATTTARTRHASPPTKPPGDGGSSPTRASNHSRLLRTASGGRRPKSCSTPTDRAMLAERAIGSASTRITTSGISPCAASRGPPNSHRCAGRSGFGRTTPRFLPAHNIDGTVLVQTVRGRGRDARTARATRIAEPAIARCRRAGST